MHKMTLAELEALRRHYVLTARGGIKLSMHKMTLAELEALRRHYVLTVRGGIKLRLLLRAIDAWKQNVSRPQ